MERATAANDGADDDPAAARTWLTSPPVHVELLLHPAGIAACVHVVTPRRAAETDALSQDPLDGFVQSRHFERPK